jgi:chaperonin cofactor prefoldin
MFGLFKKKTPLELLQNQYKELLNEAHQLSSINRKASDAKIAEADIVLKEIEKLKAKL